MGDEDVDSEALALFNRMGRRMEDGEGVHVLSYTVFTSTQGRTDERTNAECYLVPIDRFSSLCTRTSGSQLGYTRTRPLFLIYLALEEQTRSIPQ